MNGKKLEELEARIKDPKALRECAKSISDAYVAAFSEAERQPVPHSPKAAAEHSMTGMRAEDAAIEHAEHSGVCKTFTDGELADLTRRFAKYHKPVSVGADGNLVFETPEVHFDSDCSAATPTRPGQTPGGCKVHITRSYGPSSFDK